MKRINNKGFAISVLIYSLATIALLTLLLILGTLSGMRKNESSLVDSVKEDLNAMSRTVKTYGYKEEVQVFKAATAGDYKIQLWGASGGSKEVSRAGMGGYISFVVSLSADDSLYIVVGDEGKCPTEVDKPNKSSFTTGGVGNLVYSLNSSVGGCNGGGATFIFGSSDDKKPTFEELMDGSSGCTLLAVAGGGGGAGLKGGVGGHAYSGSGRRFDGISSGSTEGENPDGNIIGTTARNSAPGFLAGTDLGIGSQFKGGTLESPYYIWEGSGIIIAQGHKGYAGSGGGGGYYGGGASAGSYTGAGGGSNYVNSIVYEPVSLSGDSPMPKKDTSNSGNYSDPETKHGNGFVIIEKQ